MNIAQSWDTLCPPAQIYPIVMVAVVLFSLYRGAYREAVTHSIGLFIGTMFLWVLCAANLEMVAYALLCIPIIFFLFFLAVVLYDQAFQKITHRYKRCGHRVEHHCRCLLGENE